MLRTHTSTWSLPCLSHTLPSDPKWCKKNEKACKILSNIDLTGPIGTKRLCSVSSADYDSEEPQDMRILQHGAIHLVFEAEGSSNPLDSPSRLFVTDVDSKCDVRVDGQPLQKGERALVKPGSVIAMGQVCCTVLGTPLLLPCFPAAFC